MSGAPGARRILVVAGEASGDRHAAGLVREARRLDPLLSFSGIGGDHLRAAGARLVRDMSGMAVVGVTEVLGQVRQLAAALFDMRRRIRAERPDALLIVDLPDFNLHLAGVAAKLRIPVVYFVSPQVWAWRQGRVRTIRRRISRMIVLFPFEEDFYRRHGVPVTFAGHPLADEPVAVDRREARRRLGLDAEAPVFGLLPGSRSAEVARLLDPLLETGREALLRAPAARFVMPVAQTLDAAALQDKVARSGLPVMAVAGQFDHIVAACDAAVAASGTVTLELAQRGVPMVVVYRTSVVSYWIGRLFVKVPFVSLVNLIAGWAVVPELLQGDFTPSRAAAALLALCSPGPSRDACLAGMAEVRGRLGPPGAYARAAAAFLEALDEAGLRRGQSPP